MKIKLNFLVFVFCFLLSFQCFAQDNVISVKAPEEVVRLWKQFNGKYVMYIHKEAHVKTFENIDGMVLMVAYMDCSEILEDAKNFTKKSGLKITITIQNNPKFYDKQFLERTNYIGMMVNIVAEHYKFDKNAKLARLVFE